jgi:hypothetical protein
MGAPLVILFMGRVGSEPTSEEHLVVACELSLDATL